MSIAPYSCAPILSQDLMNTAILDVPFSEIKEHPDFYKDKTFILGGMIIETKATEKGSSIESLYVPVNQRGQLLSIEKTTDRYLAIYPKDRGYLDSMVFRKERKFSIAGKFIELQTGRIEHMEYIYPVFEILELHLMRDWRTGGDLSTTLFYKEKEQKMDYETSQSLHIPMENKQTSNEISSKSSVLDRDDKRDPSVNNIEEVQIEDTDINELSESEQKQPVNKIEAVEEVKEGNKIQEQGQVENQRQALTEDAKEQDVIEVQSEPFTDDNETDKLSTNELDKSEKRKEVIEETHKLKEKEEVPDIKQSVAKKDIKKGNAYYVQVGAWEIHNYAQKMLEKIIIYYPEAYIVEDNNLNKLRIPGILSKKQGVTVSNDIEKKFNLKPIVVQKK
jgi:outer membrane lipoprotein